MLGGFCIEAGETVNHNVAELQLCPDTQSLAVMTSRKSVRQKKNNELMMTSWTHMLGHTGPRTHTHTHAQTHKFLMSLRFSAVPQFTKAATDRLIWSARPPQHLLLSLLLGIYGHTKLPTGIKAYINSRGPDTINPDHYSHTSGSSTVQQDHVNAVLIKDC